MFQQMLNSSRAVLFNPSVATFEEYERNDLGWATIYIAISAVISAILSAIGFLIQQALGANQAAQLEQLEQQFGGQLPPGLDMLSATGSLTGVLALSLIGALLAFFIWASFVYGLGRLFGGTGAFGELAYDIALFSAPMTVIQGVVGLVPIPCVGGLVLLALAVYNIYLSYLSIQAGMNLPSNKALVIVLIPIVLMVLACCGLFAVIFAAASSLPTAP